MFLFSYNALSLSRLLCNLEWKVMEWAHIGTVRGKGIKGGGRRPCFMLGNYCPGICLDKGGNINSDNFCSIQPTQNHVK
jgi:hypothetical protein